MIPESPGATTFKQIIDHYKKVFDPELPAEGSNLEPMTIELCDDRPVNQRPRPLNPSKRELVRDEIRKLRQQGFIQTSKGPYSSPVVVVTGGHKGSKKIRLCVDY